METRTREELLRQLAGRPGSRRQEVALGTLMRLAVAFLPLCLTPVLLHGLASGAVDLGGGEKDLVWMLPWALWSVLFGAFSLWFWHRGLPLVRSTLWSGVYGALGVAGAAVLLAAAGQLGVAGRF